MAVRSQGGYKADPGEAARDQPGNVKNTISSATALILPV